MQVGLDLGQIQGYGFDAYKGWTIKAITRDEVIVKDGKGREVRLEGPKPVSRGVPFLAPPKERMSTPTSVVISLNFTFKPTAAFAIRAPSMCNNMPLL